jgi:DHA1 family multidrug resistance protein-like MFS transporter
MTAAAAPPSDWRRNQIAVTVAAFVGFTGFTLVMPFLPLYFEQLGTHDPGAIAIWSGVSLGITPAITAMMAPFWARIADRYGRKLMVARSLFSFVVIMSATAFVTAPWQVFALRALQGVFAGYGMLAMTMAAESAPPDRMAMAIGWVQTAQRIGPALGPLIGGTLAQTFGLRQTFLISASFYLGACLLVLIGFRERRQPLPVPPERPAAVPWQTLRRTPHFVLFMAAVFALQLVDRSFGPILPLYLRETGQPAASVPFLSGLLFSITAASAAFGNQIAAFLLARTTVNVLIPAGALGASLAAVAFGAGAPLAILVVAGVLFGAGLGVSTTAIYTGASHALTTATRGVGFGYLTRASLVGLAVSPVIAGLVGAFNMRAVFVADAMALVLIAYWLNTRLKVR